MEVNALTARASNNMAVEATNDRVRHLAPSRTSKTHKAMPYVTTKIPTRRVSMAKETN